MTIKGNKKHLKHLISLQYLVCLVLNSNSSTGMKPELVLSKQSGNSDVNETTTNNNNLMAVLPEMSEIQGIKY